MKSYTFWFWRKLTYKKKKKKKKKLVGGVPIYKQYFRMRERY